MNKSNKNKKRKRKVKEIVIKFWCSEILERKASKFGTGAHVIIPKKYTGKKIKIIVGEDKNE